jgi:hypothetical protein
MSSNVGTTARTGAGAHAGNNQAAGGTRLGYGKITSFHPESGKGTITPFGFCNESVAFTRDAIRSCRCAPGQVFFLDPDEATVREFTVGRPVVFERTGPDAATAFRVAPLPQPATATATTPEQELVAA